MAKNTGLASVSEGEAGRLLRIDPRKLNIKPGWNSRDFSDPANIEHIDELATSIVAQGVKQPLTVSWSEGKAWIEDGECRWRAAMRAIDHYKHDLKAIPCRVEEQHVNDADKLLYQYIRNTGKRFSAMEASNHFKRLLGAGYSATDIATKTGLSQGRISQILNLQTLPEPVKQMVTQGQVSASLAASTVNEMGASEAEKALKNGWNAAKDEGATKVKPEHIEGAKPQLVTVVRDAFEYADVDDSEDDFVVVKFPTEQWQKIREALKL